MSQVGVRNMLLGGAWTISIATTSFGFIEFIPDKDGLFFTAIGFFIRVIQGIGAAAVFTSAITYLTLTFTGTFILVSKLIYNQVCQSSGSVTVSHLPMRCGCEAKEIPLIT